MEKILSLTCDQCKSEYEPLANRYVCDKCEPDLGNLTVNYNVMINKNKFRINESDYTHFRYHNLLPISDNYKSLNFPNTGWTPLYSFPELAAELGISKFLIKDDGKNPSSSYKDRASSICVAKAVELGTKVITAASTGNAASSLALFATIKNITTVIFVPESTPKAKIAQLMIFGAKVFSIKGSYDQAFDLCLEASKRYGWYNRNTGYNPYLLEGKKTGAFELAEQTNFNIPDTVVVSVGDGCIISGLYKGFKEFYDLGLIKKIPKLIGVQAEGSAPLVNAFLKGSVIAKSIEAKTIADSICVGTPRVSVKALQAVKKTNGLFISVTDEQILSSQIELARKTGVFAEPAASAAFAGVKKLANNNKLQSNERVALFITGNGLKDINTIINTQKNRIFQIPPDIYAVEKSILVKKLLK